jgi:hypothetical protein
VGGHATDFICYSTLVRPTRGYGCYLDRLQAQADASPASWQVSSCTAHACSSPSAQLLSGTSRQALAVSSERTTHGNAKPRRLNSPLFQSRGGKMLRFCVSYRGAGPSLSGSSAKCLNPTGIPTHVFLSLHERRRWLVKPELALIHNHTWYSFVDESRPTSRLCSGHCHP